MCDQDDISQWLQNDSIRRLYADYAGIRNLSELAMHCEAIRARLGEGGKPYKCIEQYRFLASRLATRFYYPRILALGRQQQAPLFIDVGCCTGTDLRQLLLDGYPGTCLVGTDISKHYIECGYDLFRDRETCTIQFMTGDMFDSRFLGNDSGAAAASSSSPLPGQHHESLHCFRNRAGVVYSGSVIHLLQSNDQVDAFIGKVTLLLSPGALFVGTHVAADQTVSVYIPSRHYTKHWTGIHDFKALLERHHFEEIEFQLEPRFPREEEKPHLTVQCHWLSFSAVYRPHPSCRIAASNPSVSP